MTTTMVNATASTNDWRTIFQSRDVTWLWAWQVISQIGDGLTKMSMSLLWLVYHLTGSSLKMGLAGAGSDGGVRFLFIRDRLLVPHDRSQCW